MDSFLCTDKILIHFLLIKKTSIYNADSKMDCQQTLNLDPRAQIQTNPTSSVRTLQGPGVYNLQYEPFPVGSYKNIDTLSFSNTNPRTCQNVSFQNLRLWPYLRKLGFKEKWKTRCTTHSTTHCQCVATLCKALSTFPNALPMVHSTLPQWTQCFPNSFHNALSVT